MSRKHPPAHHATGRAAFVALAFAIMIIPLPDGVARSPLFRDSEPYLGEAILGGSSPGGASSAPACLGSPRGTTAGVLSNDMATGIITACSRPIPTGFTGSSMSQLEGLYLERALVYRLATIELAELAQSRGTHASLREYAAGVEKEARRDVAKLRLWIDELNHGRASAELNDTLLGIAFSHDIARVKAIGSAGFDLGFAEYAIAHEARMKNLSDGSLRTTQNPATRVLVKNLSAESDIMVAQFTKLRAAWLASAAPAPGPANQTANTSTGPDASTVANESETEATAAPTRRVPVPASAGLVALVVLALVMRPRRPRVT